MMELFLAGMNFISDYFTVIVILIFLPSIFLVIFSRFGMAYKKPWRYLMGALSLLVAVLIAVLALPFWIVVFSGYSTVFVLLLAICLALFILKNVLVAIDLFTGGKVIILLRKVFNKK